jgi:lysophospholipase L1-like esterase
VAIKPSPSRRQFFQAQTRANQLIRKFVGTHPRLSYIDVVPAMLDASGEPRTELFLEDRLHMNSQGYELWRRTIEDFLTHPKRKPAHQH